MVIDNWIVMTVVLTLVISLVSGYMAYRSTRKVTVEGVLETVKESVPIAQELATVAKIAVESAEQMKRDGTLRTNDAALNYAIDYVQKWFPATETITNEQIIGAINAAVLTASAISAQITAAKQSVAPPQPILVLPPGTNQ